MKKLIGILVVLLLIGVAAVFVLSKTAGKIIRKGVVTLGPEIAQVNIELESVDISFIDGSGVLKGFKVHNPEGYSGDHAFYADHLELDIAPMSVLSDKIVIEEIRIIGPDIQFEQKMKTSNLNQILKNVQDYMGPAEQQEETSAATKKLEIKHFIMQEAKVGVGVGTKPISLTISSIELNNLGSGEEGVTAGEVVGVLLTEVTSQVIAAILKDPQVVLETGGNLIKNIGGSGGNALNKLGGLFGGKKDEAAPAEETNK
jgi:hypothetical protein